MYMYKWMKTDIEGYVFLSNPHALKFGTLSMSQTIDLYCTTFERVNSSHDTCCSFVGNSRLVSHTLTDLGPTHWNFLVFMNIYSSQYIDEKVKSKIMLWNHAVYNRWIRKHLRDLGNFLYESMKEPNGIWIIHENVGKIKFAHGKHMRDWPWVSDDDVIPSLCMLLNV